MIRTLLVALSLSTPLLAQETARGVVYHDKNGNEVRDAHEPGLPNVKVSNGVEVVATDAEGRWQLPVHGDCLFFVIKPRGWTPPRDATHVHRYFYIHKPEGSPALRFPGSAPTGPLPASIDFPLQPQAESTKFEVVLFGDPQPYSIQDVHYLARDIVPELVGTPAKFGITLGDIVGDDLALFDPLTEVTAQIGIPWWYVYGNHDMNFDARSDEHADESYERRFGPTNFAFQYGDVHFIGLDNVDFQPRDGRRGGYRGTFSSNALAFVRNYLKFVPKEHLVVTCFHIHLDDRNMNRPEFFELFAEHPHNVSISAHTHIHRTLFFGQDAGYPGPGEHVHLNMGTTSGSWWKGEIDTRGVPHTRMRDGAPNGYGILRLDGNRYALRYKAARRAESYQMDIHAPDAMASQSVQGTEVLANVFGGSERSEVWMRVGDRGMWSRMKRIDREDPAYVALKERESRFRQMRVEAITKALGSKAAKEASVSDEAKAAIEASVKKGGIPTPWKPLPNPVKSSHLWAGTLPKLAPGTYLIHVRTRDMFGEEWTGRRVLRVTGTK